MWLDYIFVHLVWNHVQICNNAFCAVQMLHDLNTYLHKAIPDTKLTIRKYLDVKFEYLVSWLHSVQLWNFQSASWSVDRETPNPFVLQSYCLKVKEMDDEEYTSIVGYGSEIVKFIWGCTCNSNGSSGSFHQCSFQQAMGEPLYRVCTGNYEYRLVLRCRQEARARFAKMRKDVLEKIELLDQKHGWLAFSAPPLI